MATTITGSGVDNIIDGTITNADINASAGIAGSKVDGSFGKVLQVVHGTTSIQAGNGGTSYTSTGLSASITPLSTSSKILVSVNQYFTFRTTTNAERKATYRLLRDGSQLVANTYNSWHANNSSETRVGMVASFNYLSTPNTTSSTIYSTEHKINNSAADVYAQHDGTTSDITLLEIAG